MNLYLIPQILVHLAHKNDNKIFNHKNYKNLVQLFHLVNNNNKPPLKRTYNKNIKKS